jgi:NTP pyrophosphatase (non-canonical NTP hydrolase)
MKKFSQILPMIALAGLLVLAPEIPKWLAVFITYVITYEIVKRVTGLYWAEKIAANESLHLNRQHDSFGQWWVRVCGRKDADKSSVRELCREAWSRGGFSFRDFTELMESTAVYPERGKNLVYPALGAAGEAGELAEKIKKMWRDHNITCNADLDARRLGSDPVAHELTKLKVGAIKEIGDVLWYLDQQALELGVTLEEVAKITVNKILDRQARGVIGGSGDNR